MKTADFEFINSLTKYPSIPTYHTMESGRLTNGLHPIATANDDYFITEKVDGTNSRIIVCSDDYDYLIGSRENILYAKGDRVGDPSQGIVAAIRDLAEHLCDECNDNYMTCIYGETYGGRTNNAKNYTDSGSTGFASFDIFEISLEKYERWQQEWERDKAGFSARRESFHSQYLPPHMHAQECDRLGIKAVPKITPGFDEPLPQTRQDALAFLKTHTPKTRAAISGDGGHSEGLVIRNWNGGQIAKMRYEDYAKALRGK